MRLKAPFPWFGGKSRAADLIWSRFGDVPNYVEPFFGSGAVLLLRPHVPRVETVNDKDCFVANFWRAIQVRPDEVAFYCDWPVNETDLHARHQWLVDHVSFVEKMKSDPDYFDARVAGYWVWGISMWIGGGWCRRPEWSGRVNAGRAPRGIAGKTWLQRPHLSATGMGVHRQLPDISGDSGAVGRGVHSKSVRENLTEHLVCLSDRLRQVRVCCGEWSRVLGPSPTTKIGVTGIVLDPPYSAEADRDPTLYKEEDLDVAHAAAEWAIENGENPSLRIALCGYEGEHVMPENWECVAWKAHGGYGNRTEGRGRVNATRERVWFSPHCLKPEREPELALGGKA